jgi:hypothetical protein
MPGTGDEDLDEDVEDAATVQMKQGELAELMKGLATPEPAARAGSPSAPTSAVRKPTPALQPSLDGDDSPSQLPESQRVRLGEAGQKKPEPTSSPLRLILPLLVVLMLALALIFAWTQLA